MNSSDFRNDARLSLKGNWKGIMIISVWYIALQYFNFFFIEGNVSEYTYNRFDIISLLFLLLIISPFMNVFEWLTLSIQQERKSNFLFELNEVGYLKIVLYNLLKCIYITLWSLLLLLPGIVKIYSYAMSSYLLRENKDLSVNQAITVSRRMMDGYKWKLFKLDVTFLGWFILSFCTLGLLFLYVNPYYYTARASFYECIKRERSTIEERLDGKTIID